MEPLPISGDGLTVADVAAVARDGRQVALAPEAFERMTAARAVAERIAAAGEPVYGLTTGMGALRGVALNPADVERYSDLTIRAHRTRHGQLLPEEVSRAAMLHRANALSRGRSMVRPQVAEAFVDALNDGFAPRIQAIGSVGQTDLPATAELIFGLVQAGRLRLEQGEALAALNANSLSVGVGALALHDLGLLLDAYDVVGALSLEGYAGNLSVLHPDIDAARPFAGISRTRARLAELLRGSRLHEPGVARQLQDPLSFRCIAQVHGAARDALAYATGQLEIELNSSGDNPMVVAAEDRIVSVGNFDVTPVAAALDLARVALASVLTLSCERIQKHLDGHFSGLATGLRADEGPDDAFALIGGGAAAVAAEARLLAQPVSIELPTSTIAAGIEDHITMAPLGARRLAEMIELGGRLAAVELVVTAQAIDLRPDGPLGEGTAPAYAHVRELVPFTGPGQAPSHDLDAVAAWVVAGMG